MSIKEAFEKSVIDKTKREIRFLKGQIKYNKNRIKELEKMLSQAAKGE